MSSLKTLSHGDEQLERLVLSATMRIELERYCTAETTLEVCGLIGGVGEVARSFYPTKNIAEDPSRSYAADPQDHISALNMMRQRREQLLCIFHSHPSSKAEPSAADLALAAYPGVAYLIASLVSAKPDFEAYLFTGTQFKKLPLEIIDTNIV